MVSTSNLCTTCGTPTNNPKFCSRSCAAKKNNQGVRRHGQAPRGCENCGKRLEESKAKFCSNQCQHNKRFKENVAAALSSGTFDSICDTPSARKRILLAIKGHACEICTGTEWMNQPIPLVMDHIDGNSDNHCLANLRLVCGNCDMLLPTYKSKNKGNGRHFRRNRYANGQSF